MPASRGPATNGSWSNCSSRTTSWPAKRWLAAMATQRGSVNNTCCTSRSVSGRGMCSRAVSTVSAGSPDAANKDWAGVLAPGLAVVLDGLSAPDGTGTGCRHGTPWFVSQLGPRLLALAADPARSLVDALAEAIQQVASLHPGAT
jgi:hypothetical protein